MSERTKTLDRAEKRQGTPDKERASAQQPADTPAVGGFGIASLQQVAGNLAIQRRSTRADSGEPPRPGSATHAALTRAGHGEVLSPALRHRMEGAFGIDLGSVRLHQDAPASDAAQEIDARAFTHGRDIFFGAGNYQPDTRQGQRLLAHELAHTVQQRNAPAPAPHKPEIISTPGDALEREAESAAGQALAGDHRSPVSLATDSRAGLGVIAREPAGQPAQAANPPPPAPAPALEPQHRNEKIATWTGFVDTSVKTSSMIGQVAIARHAEPIGAIPASISRVGWTPGYYPSEAAAIAAIGAAGTAGAVFIENGQYVAYHALGEGMVYSFTLENLRWFSNKPWTGLRFDSTARAIVTNDGATLRPEHYKTKADAKTAVPDQSLMPGEQDPFVGFQQAFGDLSKPGTLELVFHPAMKANALSVLSRGRVQVEREIERRFSSGIIPPSEIALMRSTAQYLADLDEEIDRVPKTIPPDPDALRRFNALRQRRQVVLARYPMLARINPRDFVKLPEDQQQSLLGTQAQKVLEDIDETRNNVIGGSLNLWKISPLIESTIAGLGIRDAEQRKHILDLARANETSITENIIQIFSIVFGLASAFVTGPLGLALAAGALGLGVADALKQTEEMFAESAAANTSLDPQGSLLPPEELKSWGWLVLAWVGVVADAAQVVQAIKAVRAADGAIEAGVKILAKGDEQLAGKLRLAAGAPGAGEVINEANRVGLANRLGTTLEIDASLGKEVRVAYSVDKRGRGVLEGMRCGPEATAGEILAHAPVIRMLSRYDGLVGRLRELIDRLLSFAGVVPSGVNPFKAGSQTFESFLELTKLDEVIRLRQAELGKAIGTNTEALLRRDIQFLESELARHQEVVNKMTLEQGLGYIARAEEQTQKAISQGMPALAGHPLIPDATRYYYRINPTAPPPYVLTRFANASVPPRALVADGSGGWKIAEGALSRLEQASALVSGWNQKLQEAYHALESAHGGAGVFRVVPLQGVASTGKKLNSLIDAGKQQEIYDILVRAFRSAKDPDPAARATKAMSALLEHDITLVRGTDQLRAYNYRLAFETQAGKEASGDLHHLIPFYLGGDNKLLLDMNPVLHAELHSLIDAIPFEAGTALAPSSVLGAKSLSFSAGAAVLRSDGTVQLARLNLDGTFTLVP